MNGKVAKRLRKEMFDMPFIAALINYKTDRNGALRAHPGSYRGLFKAFKKAYREILKSGDNNPMQTFIASKEQILKELNT